MTRKGILGLIPLRAGSKGVPGKNIRPLNGIPLCVHSLRAAQESAALEDILVSTDSETYRELLVREGAWAPFLRPAELASDDARSVDVVLHALDYLEREHGKSYEAVCLLQATCPLRGGEDVRASVQLYREHAPCAVVSVTLHEEPHPYKMKVIRDGNLYPFLEGQQWEGPRQALPPVYRLNGGIYITPVSTLREKRSFFCDENTKAYCMPKHRSVNIDSEEDFLLAEMYVARYGQGQVRAS